MRLRLHRGLCIQNLLIGSPPEVDTSGGLLFALWGVPFFSLIWAKKRSKRNSTAKGWAHALSVLCPSPSLRSVVAPIGALLYASKWRTYARSIGRLWGRKAPQSRGCPSSPESSLRGAFFCGRKPPIPPKKPLRISPQLITLDDQIIAPTYRSCRSFHYGEVSMCESLHFVARVYER